MNQDDAVREVFGDDPGELTLLMRAFAESVVTITSIESGDDFRSRLEAVGLNPGEFASAVTTFGEDDDDQGFVSKLPRSMLVAIGLLAGVAYERELRNAADAAADL